MSTSRIFIALIALAILVGSAGACSRKESLDPSTMPENIRADYALFAQRCSKCHTLARPLNANITDDDQWVMYVNRMRRQPASGISLEDQDGILRFLRYYAAELRRVAAAKHGGAPRPSASASETPVSPGVVDGGAP